MSRASKEFTDWMIAQEWQDTPDRPLDPEAYQNKTSYQDWEELIDQEDLIDTDKFLEKELKF